jgi:hypothetical protein
MMHKLYTLPTSDIYDVIFDDTMILEPQKVTVIGKHLSSSSMPPSGSPPQSGEGLALNPDGTVESTQNEITVAIQRTPSSKVGSGGPAPVGQTDLGPEWVATTMVKHSTTLNYNFKYIYGGNIIMCGDAPPEVNTEIYKLKYRIDRDIAEYRMGHSGALSLTQVLTGLGYVATT